MRELRRIDERATIALFLLALAGPALATIFTDKEAVSEDEGRALAPPPAFRWSLDTLDTWPDEFEDYYNDHFALRSFLLQRYNRLRFGFFGISPTDEVVVGRNGWLYLAEGTREFAPLDRAELGRWQQRLERRRDWLEEQGIRYLFVAVPDKTDGYPEFMPLDLQRAKVQSRIDLFCQAMSERTTVPVLNLGPPMRAAKTRDEIYFRNDPHWNHLGAFLAYEEIMREVRGWFPDVEPLVWDELGIEKREVRGGGLARMMGLKEHLTEVTYRIEPDDPGFTATRIELAEEPVLRSPFAMELDNLFMLG